MADGLFLFKRLFFLFCHSFKAFDANRSPFATDSFHLKVKVLPLNGFNVGVRPGGAFS